MTSQNRLNAGAEYVLYRIWATLQTEQGIHVESLLTCVGGLAGYACRSYARQLQTLSGGDSDDRLVSVLGASLIDSPLSIWSLVSRAVLKLEQPLPDIHEIVRRASQTAAADTRQVPQLPNWHRPQQPAIVYLKQLWPQTLPIAQRFCLRPMQMPVLYGIALQRAIEHTKDLLSPTLAASISMECAIAMSRVELPEPATNAVVAAIPAAPLALPSMSATPQSQRKAAVQNKPSPSRLLTIVKQVPPAAHVATIACLAFITTASAMYRPDGGERPTVALQTTVLAAANPPTESEPAIDPQGPEIDTQLDEPQPFPAELTAQTIENPNDSTLRRPYELVDLSDDEGPPIPQPSNYGSDNEGLMRDDAGQPIRMASEE